jgi:hypothetical protein
MPPGNLARSKQRFRLGVEMANARRTAIHLNREIAYTIIGHHDGSSFESVPGTAQCRHYLEIAYDIDKRLGRVASR